MSNKAVSVYAEALKRQKQEEQTICSPIAVAQTSGGTSPKITAREPGAEFSKSGGENKQEMATVSKHDSLLTSALACYHDSTVELLRKSVRFFGKEPFFGRFTPEEKGMLKEIAYTYQRQGIKTTENEIARIAFNFLREDYRQNGENSLLDRVLKALHI